MLKTDEIIISQILSNDDRLRNKALEKLYDFCFTLVRNFVTKNSGTEEDAKDVFQDGIAILYQNMLQGKFNQDSSIKTYTFSICRNLWLMKIRKNAKINEIDITEGLVEIEDVQSQFTNLKKLEHILGELNADCQKVLTAFYLESKSMKELQDLFQLGSIQATKNKKLRCMKHLMQLISKKKLTPNDFME